MRHHTHRTTTSPGPSPRPPTRCASSTSAAVVGDGTWTARSTTSTSRSTDDRTHCECCGLEKRLRRGNGSAEAFRVDRGRLRAHLIAEGETDPEDDARPARHPRHRPASDRRLLRARHGRRRDPRDHRRRGQRLRVRRRRRDHRRPRAGPAARHLRGPRCARSRPWASRRRTSRPSTGRRASRRHAACSTEILRVASGLVPSLRALQLLEASHETIARGLRSDQALSDPALANLVVATGGALVRRHA